MERRFETQMAKAMTEATVDPAVFRGMLSRLQRFVEPFAASLKRREQLENTQQYVAGLLSTLKRKNAEAIAYHHDEERQGMQKFIGQVSWDHQPLLAELAKPVGADLGEPDGVIVFDPSAFPKKGTESVGVKRQWCGRLGKVDNCQVGVFMGYASRTEHALVDLRLYLPKEWAKNQRRRKKCGVPKDVRFHTRHQLSLQMLAEQGAHLPHAWIAGDDEMGRSSRFRQDLRDLNERYLLAVPSNTRVRDREAQPPPACGRGRHPKVPFQRADRWVAALDEEAWTTIDVRDGAKGPLIVQAVKARVWAKTEKRKVGPDEVLVVLRERQQDGTLKHDYYLSNAEYATPLSEFVRVAKAEHRIEDCLQRAKSEAGLAEYQVRNWRGWHHHQSLSLIATWFLTQEARRGKKRDARHHGLTDPLGDCFTIEPRPWLRPRRSHLSQCDPAFAEK